MASRAGMRRLLELCWNSAQVHCMCHARLVVRPSRAHGAELILFACLCASGAEVSPGDQASAADQDASAVDQDIEGQLWEQQQALDEATSRCEALQEKVCCLLCLRHKKPPGYGSGGGSAETGARCGGAAPCLLHTAAGSAAAVAPAVVPPCLLASMC